MLTAPRTAFHFALLAALLVVGSEATPAPGGTQRNAPPAYAAGKPLAPVEGEVIVRFKSGARALQQHGLAKDAGAEVVATVLGRRAAALGARVGRPLEAGRAVGDRMQVVRQVGADAAELARRLAADPDVEFAEPNGRQRRLQAVPPNDPLYASGPTLSPSTFSGGPEVGQWYLRAPDNTFKAAINVPTAWARGFGNTSVVVAVLDTGVRFEHPDLGGRASTGGRLLDGYDFVSGLSVAGDGNARDADASDPGDWIDANDRANPVFASCDVSDSSWHGTATASLVGAAANDAIGMAGTAPGVRVLPVRVLGKCFGQDSDILAAMRWAAGIHVDGVPDNANRAKVINLSLGSSGTCSAAYQATVDEVLAQGAVVVAAAGNSRGEPVGTPASCNGVIAVAALRHVGTKVGFSDLGPQIAISAPGGNCININVGEPCLYPILAAMNAGLTTPTTSKWSDSYDSTIGTSFSAPLVAGTVGLMFSQNPALTVTQVRTLLQGTARPFPTTGGTPGTPACNAPAQNVVQDECYCPNAGTTGYPLCGAGMLDAGAAVNASATGLAAIDVSTPTQRGQAITLDSARSVAASGRLVASWSWSIVSGGGAVSAFTGSTTSATATLTPTAVGTFVVRLAVTDSAGGTNTTQTTVTVTEPPASGNSSGGGAASVAWTLLLALAAVALRVRAPKRRA